MLSKENAQTWLEVPSQEEEEDGVPEGGTAGQVLSKIDAEDFNTQWVDQTGGDEGGEVSLNYEAQADITQEIQMVVSEKMRQLYFWVVFNESIRNTTL